MIFRNKDMRMAIAAEFNPLLQFNYKRGIIQDLYYLSIISCTFELKDFTFFNFNAEIAITIGGCMAVGTDNKYDYTETRFIGRINHLTRNLKLFGTNTKGE